VSDTGLKSAAGAYGPAALDHFVQSDGFLRRFGAQLLRQLRPKGGEVPQRGVTLACLGQDGHQGHVAFLVPGVEGK